MDRSPSIFSPIIFLPFYDFQISPVPGVQPDQTLPYGRVKLLAVAGRNAPVPPSGTTLRTEVCSGKRELLDGVATRLYRYESPASPLCRTAEKFQVRKVPRKLLGSAQMAVFDFFTFNLKRRALESPWHRLCLALAHHVAMVQFQVAKSLALP